ncbi:MAG: L-serine ammonia-lyase, iron-sulfur-dependent subunit beta [Synergistaceae bacterium]|nr:L-serine ammonia-lyase, iron-sulfur-dependent subunit beta [Synergistaceae bacterium]
MPIWNIIGPVMIGPSSSHTAGAVSIGRMVRMCWGSDVKRADIYMRGSFATTGSGHGTDRAILAGLLGYTQDDPAVRDGIELARKAGIDFHFYVEDIEGAHPNSARIVLSDGTGRIMDAVGASVGGGSVCLQELDGFQIDISGVLPAIIIINRDIQGVVSAVTSFLSQRGINIATMKLRRDARGGLATMVLELDADGDTVDIDEMRAVHPAIVRVITIPGQGAV